MSHDTGSSSRAANTGRHRNGGAGTWTPSIPTQSHTGGHGAHELPPGTSDTAGEHGIPTQEGGTHGRLSGKLPIATPPPGRDAPEPDETPTGPLTPGAVPDSASSEQRTERPTASREAGRRPQRTRVTFTRPEMRPAETGADEKDDEDEEPEPSPSGLGVFDLGSVPASVTPPRTWRRAAWFAAASSGGVMGLLFAGSFLLGQPTQPEVPAEWAYLNRRATAPLLERDEWLRRKDPTTSHESASAESDTSRPRSSTASEDGVELRTTTATVGNSPSPPTSSAPNSAPTNSAPTTSSVSRTPTRPSTRTSTSRPPRKPPPPPVETTVVNERPPDERQLDVQEMAERSQTYFETVTENPERAHELTAGQLEAEGTEGLRRRYAEVAYFEVRKVVVNEGKGVTVNTVRTVYEDGHAEIQQRTLVFNADSEITKARE